MEPTKHYLEAELEELIQTDPVIWRFIRDGSLDGVWYWDLENPENEWMSPEFWRVLGVDPETKAHFAGEWQDLIFGEDLELAKQNLARHIEDPEHPYDQIVRYRHAAGGVAWVRCRGLAIRDENGKAVRLLGAHNEVTDLMQVQERLTRSNTLLNHVLNSVGTGIIGLDRTGRIVVANPAACEILGDRNRVPPFDWPGETELLDPSSLEPLDPPQHPVNRVLAGQVLSGTTVLISSGKNTANRYIRISSRQISDESVEVESVLVLENVTDEEITRQSMERTQRLDVLEQLSGGIAHDFNNVLATIQYSIQLVMNGVSGGKPLKYLRTALESTARGAALTRRLLAFAKPQPSRVRRVNASDVLQDLSGLAAPSIEESIVLEIEKPSGPLYVVCDDQHLENALLNLVLNSRDAIVRSGIGGRISISSRAVSGAGQEDGGRASDTPLDPVSGNSSGAHDGASQEYIELVVSDDGPGMPEEVKDRAVDPFFTTKEHRPGQGLGLTMVYGFVQRLNGVLRIESEPGNGTIVRIFLPRDVEETEKESLALRTVPPTEADAHILVVEDQEDLLDMTSELVEGLGYWVSRANSGVEALRHIETGERFDLLLTDIVMPDGMSGFELAKEVRTKMPRVKVVYMSGYVDFKENEVKDAAGPILQKPCPPDELAKILKQSLGASSVEAGISVHDIGQG